MSRPKGSPDKSKRKKETKPRNTLGYYKRYAKKHSDCAWLTSDLSPAEEKALEIKILWNQLDAIRRTPVGKIGKGKSGRRYTYCNPSRSRVVQKAPVPASSGKWSPYWYLRHVSRLMLKLWGIDLSKERKYFKTDRFWYQKKIDRLMRKAWGKDYFIAKRLPEKEGLIYLPPDVSPTKRSKTFRSRVLYTAVCRMLEVENAERASKKPYFTEKEVISRLKELGVPIPFIL